MREITQSWFQNMELSDDEWRNFYNLSLDAQLLFPADLVTRLESAVDSSLLVKHHTRRSAQYREQGKHDHATEQLEKCYLEEDKLIDLMPKLLKQLIEYSRVDAWETTETQ